MKSFDFGKFKIKPACAVLIAAFVIFAVFCAVKLNPGSGILGGVSINGTPVGGMSAEEAKAVLLTKIPAEREMTLYTAKGEVKVASGDISLSYDIDKTIERAYSVGRGKNIAGNLYERVSCLFRGKDLGFVCTYNREALQNAVYGFGVNINGERKRYILEYSDSDVKVKKGIIGQSENVAEALWDFELAAGKCLDKVFVHLNKEAPPLPSTESLYDEIYIAPRDAFYEVTGGSVVLMPEVIGRQIDKIEAGTQIEKLKNGEEVTLKLVWLKPEVTLDTLNQKLFNYSLGSYSTSYPAGDAGRRANVELAASKINGTIIAPGGVFSFNETVGPRTKAAGFRDAPVFENGETVQGVGGGVCQVSSTLYSAVLYADLKITSRRNHSMTVAYVPKGQDATVAYGAIDFLFENDTAYPIKIIASAGGGKLNIAIRGTKPDKEKTVKIVNNIIETKKPTVEEVQDASLAVGTKKVLSSGKTGYTVQTTRIVCENGIETKNEVVSRSVYKMVPAKTAIGTKVPQALPALPKTPAPEVPPTDGAPGGENQDGE